MSHMKMTEPKLTARLTGIRQLSQNQLFVDDNVLAHICGIAMAKEESTKKVSLPNIIPGVEASSLKIGEHLLHLFYFTIAIQ